MQLKRKRSESELSISSSVFSSPTKPEQFTMMDLDGSNTSPLRRLSRGSTPSHLPSRTMKRFRDSRPSDEEIHRKFYEWRAHHRQISQSNNFSRQAPAERTLNMLYTAQKQHIAHQHHSQFANLATQPRPQPASTASQGAQASLHSFWKLPNTATPSSTFAQPSIDRLVYDGPSNCEDCGQALAGGSGDEDSMDVDSFSAEGETSCGACGKHVCSHCSITNMGEQRRCLICAGKKVWVGGLGWAGVSTVKVC